MLLHLRTTEQYKNARIILLMDNATIHRHPGVSKTILDMKAFLVFNPQYSPHLNPVERFFKSVKCRVNESDASSV
jgi:transposase